MDTKDKLIIQALSKSSQRNRTIFVLLVSVTIVIFCNYWNALPDNWYQSKLQLLSLIEKSKESPNTLSQKEKFKMYNLKMQYGSGNEDNGKKVIDSFNIESGRAETIERMRHTTYFTIPFLGISMHMNNLGLIGGGILSLTIIILNFGLYREFLNLKIAIRHFEKDQLHIDLNRDLLSMHQVFTIPHFSNGNWFLGNITKILIFFPAIILVLIMYNDIQTIEIGKLLNEKRVYLTTILGAVMLAFILLMSLQCLSTINRIEKLWHSFSGAEK